MLEDTSFWIWAWLILGSFLITRRGYKKIKENEVNKRKHHSVCRRK